MERIAHYHILDRIGAGGMGEVYRARDTRLGRTVAIKVLPAAVAHDRERRNRFLREARASAALSHPNICALFEVGDQDDQLFLVFEYVPGETLRQTIDGRPLNVRNAIDLAIQLADALADAHASNIVHRDIKPENIIVNPKGHPKILDFGLASFTESGRSRETAATDLKTAEGVAVGTVAYLSPEQALGVGYDHRTDIFSLGIVFYEMLTGRSPFKAPTAAATALQIVQATPPAPSAVNRNVPKEIDAVVMRALAKDPNQRYQTAATMAAELRSVVAILDVREEVEYEAPIEQRRARWRSVLALLVVLGLIAAALYLGREQLSRLRARWLGPPPPPVIAVMPFELIGGDASRLYFADGLTEDVITRLGQVPGVKVLGRSATREYRGRQPADVAAELRAAVVLTGAVRTEGDQVKVTIGLTDPRDGTQIWTSSYEKPLGNIFAVQTEVAEDVARRLSVTLAPSPVRARTAARQVNDVAYDMYLRGRDAAARRDVDRAVELYRQAIKADPALAEAHAGLVEALHLRGVFQGQFSAAARDEMRQAAVDAAGSDPDLPQAQLALGLTESSFAEALKHFRRAIDLDASYAEAYHQIGDQLMEFDPARAIAFFERSLALDPRAVIAHADMALVHASAGRFDTAAAEAAKMPQPMGAAIGGLIALHRGRPQEAVKAFEEARRQSGSGSPGFGGYVLPAYASALRQARDDARLAEVLPVLEKQAPSDCESQAMLAALKVDLGQRAAANALAAPVIAAARVPSAAPAAIRCGPMAAAAIRDGRAASAILARIAAEEPALRYWVLEIRGLTGNVWLRRGWFPFDRLPETPAVANAKRALDRAFARMRGVAAGILDGLPSAQ